MFNKIKSLVWLRTQLLKSNKTLTIQILLPYGLAVMYQQFLNPDGENGITILYMTVLMSFAMGVGSLISNTISEEKEKHNLRSLILAGVTNYEYLLATLFYPVVLTVASIVIMPLITKVDLSEHYVMYFAISFMTSLTLILINLLIGLFSESQSKAQVFATPVTLIASLLPVFASSNATLQQLMDYTFVGAYCKFFENMNSFELTDRTIVVLGGWIIGLVILNLGLFGKNKSIDKNKKQNMIVRVAKCN